MESEHASAIVDIAASLAGRAEEFDSVLIICQKKKGGVVSFDNDLTIANSLFLIESFRHWIMSASERKDQD